MYNLGIHFGTTFVFDRIDYDARQQLQHAYGIISEYVQGCPTTVYISGNQTLVQQLAKYLAGRGIPHTLGKVPARK